MKQVEKFVVVEHYGMNQVFRFKSFTRPWMYSNDVLFGIEYLGVESQKGEPFHILTMDTVDKTIHCLNAIEIPELVIKEFVSFVSMFTHKDVEGKEFNIANEPDYYYDSDVVNPVGYDFTHIRKDGGKDVYAYAVFTINEYV